MFNLIRILNRTKNKDDVHNKEIHEIAREALGHMQQYIFCSNGEAVLFNPNVNIIKESET